MAKRKKKHNHESPEGSDIESRRRRNVEESNKDLKCPKPVRQKSAPPSPLEEMAKLLHDYHKNNPNFKYPDYIAALINEHGISIGRTKLASYLADLGLSTSSRGNHMPESEQTQLILDELAKDPHQTRGPRVIKEALNLDGHKIGRNDISEVMHAFEEEGFTKRHPKGKKKLFRSSLTSVGPHEEWSMDGHDKLNKAGFGLLGMRDKWGRKEQCAPDLDSALIPPWMFLESVRNITVESGWLPVFYTWGVNVLEFFQSGLDDGFFEPGNYIHEQTSNWIWFPAVQRSLDQFCHQQNNHRIRKQHDKILPSGGTPSDFYANPAAYGGQNCLIPVEEAVLDQLLQEARAGAHEHTRYVDDGFDELAQEAYVALGKPEITLQNAWTVFQDMIGRLEQ
ncbi:hypothetical protein C8R45DRAFT_1130932 [Mycena sanguinolenta]|nr:hypothetical protein C8R45DRAFT_1130932 [Mycena sanguinolenta]